MYRDSASPFVDSFVANYLVYAMGMWPVPYESSVVQSTGRSFISCFLQPMLIMHGSLDVQSTPAGYVDNWGTISSVNGAVTTVFQQNVGHTVFYTASACVWMYMQQLAANGFVTAGAAPLLPLCPLSHVATRWSHVMHTSHARAQACCHHLARPQST